MSELRIVPVILSGGSGTRLWPVSRESFPKQLWPLLSDRSMIQETALRARGPAFAPPIVVCNEGHRFLIAEQLRAAGITNARIVLEPIGRNSAPAIAAAACLVAEDDPDAVLWMMAADAAITDTTALHTALEVAVGAARTAPDGGSSPSASVTAQPRNWRTTTSRVVCLLARYTPRRGLPIAHRALTPSPSVTHVTSMDRSQIRCQ